MYNLLDLNKSQGDKCFLVICRNFSKKISYNSKKVYVQNSPHLQYFKTEHVNTSLTACVLFKADIKQ